jgi:hypothetical protein
MVIAVLFALHAAPYVRSVQRGYTASAQRRQRRIVEPPKTTVTPTLQCPDCPREFSSYRGLRVHQLSIHSVPAAVRPANAPSAPVPVAVPASTVTLANVDGQMDLDEGGSGPVLPLARLVTGRVGAPARLAPPDDVHGDDRASPALNPAAYTGPACVGEVECGDGILVGDMIAVKPDVAVAAAPESPVRRAPLQGAGDPIDVAALLTSVDGILAYS